MIRLRRVAPADIHPVRAAGWLAEALRNKSMQAAPLCYVDAPAQMRQWLPGEFHASVAASQQVGLEYLGRGVEAEALARRGVEACAQLTELLLGKRFGWVSRQSERRRRLLVFFMASFCHGDCASQNQVWIPTSACRSGQSMNSEPWSKVIDRKA